MSGVHHITAIASSASENLKFYSGILGLRLVKKTVNFDDPYTYHLYYGDEAGTPGTILTFFPWEGMPAGRRGAGMVTSVAFAVPLASIEFWTTRLRSAGISLSLQSRFGETVVSFADPHGLALELVGTENSTVVQPWRQSQVPADHQIRGFHSASATVTSRHPTGALLTEVLGMREIGVEGKRFRFRMSGEGTAGVFYDIIEDPTVDRAAMGSGMVHHIAFRTPDAEEQKSWRQLLIARGMNVTPVIDRKYFRSIYFREAGGVLFELATDPPGFAVDEEPELLGLKLMLPQRYEPIRKRIEQALKPLPAAQSA
ncbi:MAG: ring-cleaving dioxygenase [Hyphomicrobiales bacterium]